MVESDAELERADRERQARDRAQRERLRWLALVGASYAIDTVFLALYAGAGTVPASVPLAYGGTGAAFCLIYALLVGPGWNLGLRDPNMVAPSVLWGVLAQLLVVAMAPQISFPYVVNLFTAFAFGMLWLTVREAALVWGLTMVGTGAVLYTHGPRLGVAAASGLEVALTWIFLSVILSRGLVLTVYASRLRVRLRESRRKLELALDQIRQLAEYDELTGTFNRRSVVARLGDEMIRAQRTHVPFSIAILDPDEFKAVNDRYGHAVGDAVLKGFAALVQESMRKADQLGRYGSEEFLLILTASAKAGAAAALERVCDAAALHDWGAVAPGLALTVSAGLAEYRDGESVEQLLRRADAALREAKRAGRNTVRAAD